MDLKWSASVIDAPLGKLEESFKALESAGCHELHFDIMDGAFVPNITLGFDFIKLAKAACGLPCEAHLMTAQPQRHIQPLVACGCDTITVHAEACTHPHRTLAAIREAGASPAVAINPATPLTKLDYLLAEADRVLVMTLEPGYPGQKLLKGCFERVGILKENLDYRDLDVQIQVEGNIDAHSAAVLANAGAKRFVLGTEAIFGCGGLAENLAAFSNAVDTERKKV